MSDERASRADDNQPDLRWVVEWLVEREGQAGRRPFWE